MGTFGLAAVESRSNGRADRKTESGMTKVVDLATSSRENSSMSVSFNSIGPPAPRAVPGRVSVTDVNSEIPVGGLGEGGEDLERGLATGDMDSRLD